MQPKIKNSRINAKEHLQDLYPVSYTHLDVYKRQFYRFRADARE